ncbi:MAG: TonB-dependent receptor [Terricaulis sp.]
MSKRTLLFSAAGAVGMLAALSAPAEAQTATPTASAAQASDNDQTEEIVVTAQKREEVLFNVPLPVQAVTNQQIQNSGINSVADLTQVIPGASVVSSATPGFDTVQIRGISSGTTGDGLVGYYIDETPFGVPNLQLTPPSGMLDVQRVEVIRGPSGTLYGQGSMGGTIKLVTARPNSQTFSGSVSAEASSTAGGDADYSYTGIVNIPLVAGQLALRLAGAYDHLGGYADYDDVATVGIDRRNVNDFTGVNLRGTLLWTPTNDIDVSLMYWRIQNQQGSSNSLTPGYDDPTIAGFGRGPGFTDINMDLYSLTLNWDLGFGTLTSNSSYIDHTLDFDVPFLTSFTNDSTFDTTSFTQEVRLASNNNSPLRWLVGGFYRDAQIDSDICVYFAGCSVFPIINIQGPLSTKSWSVFGEASLSLFDGKLIPLVGLRYFDDDRDSNGIDRTTLVRSNVSASWNKLSPRFNLTYNAAENLMFYANVANGFRSGSLQTPAQATAANTALGLPAGTITSQIDPDELWTYEVGGRWRTADNALQLEASVYQTDWKDVQTQFATAAVISIANAGDYRIRGFDLGVQWHTPLEGLTLALNGGINDAEIRSAPAALSAATAIDPGARVPNVPRMNYALSATYNHEIGLMGGSTLTLYSGYAFRDDQIDATTGAHSGEINDLTLRAGIRHGNWNVEAFANNLLNDDDPSVVQPASGAYQIIYPRRIGVRLGVDF